MSLFAWRKLELTGRSEVESKSFIRRRLCQLRFLLRWVNKGRSAFWRITVLRPFVKRRPRQRERLSASVMSVCLFVCLSSKFKKMRFSHGRFKEPIIVPLKSKMAEIRHLENRHDVIFSAEDGPIWIKFRRLVQNDMSTAAIRSKIEPGVKFQYGGRLGEFHGMSSQSNLPHCRVLALGEFTFMIPETHATLQGAVTWRNQCHDRATLHGVIIPSATFKIVFRHYFFKMQFRLWRATLSSPIHLFELQTYRICHLGK